MYIKLKWCLVFFPFLQFENCEKSPKLVIVQVTQAQGDQMSLWKVTQNEAQTIFCVKINAYVRSFPHKK
jgi:hypothetical protein